MKEYQINGKRLLKNLFTLAQFGRNENGGIDRALGSRADYEAREWIKHYWQEELGRKVEVDGIANLWAGIEGSEEKLPLVAGSHHDAVPDGGKYDGAMGVMIATEMMQTILEQKIPLRHPFRIVSFTGEEPNPFDLSTLGSKVISGRLTKEDLEHCQNRLTGESLQDAIERLGGHFSRLEQARIKPKSLTAFLEVHNELGRYLESREKTVSGVRCITGIYRESICVTGEANHAGTTMMQDRKDAFLALGEMADAIEKAAKQFNDPNVVATMGYVKISPNEANIVPGKAEGIVDIRTCEEAKTQKIVEEIAKAAEVIEKERGVTFTRRTLLNQPARELDSEIAAIVKEEIEKTGETGIDIVSMAGHDAANMQLVTRSGMIFVQSVGGKGHCRQEYSKDEDVVKACQIALNVLLRLDKELD